MFTQTKQRLFLLATLLSSAFTLNAEDQKTALSLTPAISDPAEVDAQMNWWREAKFGMFIHWGLYAIPANGEWTMFYKDISIDEYAKLAPKFNPVKFDAKEWVRVAKQSGMKYIVITAKHHDGFAMYDSEVSDFNIMDATPFGRDPLMELKDACAEADIKLGFYYSHAQDWSTPGGSRAKHKYWDDGQKGDFSEYIRNKSIPQVKELLERYDPAVIWFDTPAKMTPELAREVMDAVRGISKEVIVNSRLLYSGLTIKSIDEAQHQELRDLSVDYLTFQDREIPVETFWNDWETCMTLNRSWGFKNNDEDWKTPLTVVQMLARVVNKGGNFLLNYGPTAEGVLPQGGVDVTKVVGEWLKVNGESIYGAERSDLIEYGDEPEPKIDPKTGKVIKKRGHKDPIINWLATSRAADKASGSPAKIYLHIYNWPKDGLKIKGVKDSVNKAYVLSTGDVLEFKQAEGAVQVTLPKKSLNDIATVVCLEF